MSRKLTKRCAHCGILFKAYAYEIGRGKAVFHDRHCAARHRQDKLEWTTCATCNRPFRRLNQDEYCSVECEPASTSPHDTS